MMAASITSALVAICATGTMMWLRNHVRRLGVDLVLPSRKAAFIGITVLAPLTAGFTLLSWLLTTGPWSAIFLAVLGASLLVLAWIDAETMLLPDVLTIPLIWCGLLVNINGNFSPLSDAVIGAVAGFTIPWLIDKGYQFITRERGMGMGDMKLFAALGAWLGWPMLPGIFLCATTLHLTMVFLAWVASKSRNGLLTRPLPFGPAIAVAGIIAALMQWPALI